MVSEQINLLGDFHTYISDSTLVTLLNKLQIVYQKEELISPKKHLVFSYFKSVKIKNIKVVILGDFPYLDRELATINPFANDRDIIEISPELELIKDSIISNFPNYSSISELPFGDPYNYYPFDVTLKSWINQGVFLMNAVNTIEKTRDFFHLFMWKNFTKEIIQNLSKNNNIIWVFLGKECLSLEKYIYSGDILKYTSLSELVKKKQKLSSNMFTEINKILIKNNLNKINWNEY